MIQSTTRFLLLLTMMISLMIMVSCEKEISLDKLVKRNNVCYEINSEKPFSGRASRYYANGQQKEEMILQNGIGNGLSRGWRENGQLSFEENLKDGLLNGEVKTWFENGQLEEESLYKDGVAEGLTTIWYDNGQIREESYMKNNRLDGSSKIWGLSGQLMDEAIYKDGKMIKSIYENFGNSEDIEALIPESLGQ